MARPEDVGIARGIEKFAESFTRGFETQRKNLLVAQRELEKQKRRDEERRIDEARKTRLREQASEERRKQREQAATLRQLRLQKEFEGKLRPETLEFLDPEGRLSDPQGIAISQIIEASVKATKAEKKQEALEKQTRKQLQDLRKPLQKQLDRGETLNPTETQTITQLNQLLGIPVQVKTEPEQGPIETFLRKSAQRVPVLRSLVEPPSGEQVGVGLTLDGQPSPVPTEQPLTQTIPDDVLVLFNTPEEVDEGIARGEITPEQGIEIKRRKFGE